MVIKVSVESHRGWLRLRWSHQGKRPVLSMGMRDNPVGRRLAQNKANIIEADLMTGNYDATLAKYRSGESSSAKCNLTAAALFDRFMQQRKVDPRTVEKYRAIATKLRTYFQSKPANLNLAAADGFREWLGGSLQPISQKEYVRTVKTCWDWAVREGLLQAHPWDEVLKRIKVPPKQRKRPFTKAEITAILDGFRGSHYYAHYTDLVVFFLSTGCRTGEAIGLRWSHLSEDCSKVWIGESITRGVRKATKTNKAREFQLIPQLQAMLIKRRPDSYRPDDLVFPGARGGALNDRTFRKAWVKVLAAAGVAYRKPYSTRSTMISHALAQRANPLAIAEMAGHDPEVMYKHYAAEINGGLQCPDIGIL
jgi:integrase